MWANLNDKKRPIIFMAILAALHYGWWCLNLQNQKELYCNTFYNGRDWGKQDSIANQEINQFNYSLSFWLTPIQLLETLAKLYNLYQGLTQLIIINAHLDGFRQKLSSYIYTIVWTLVCDMLLVVCSVRAYLARGYLSGYMEKMSKISPEFEALYNKKLQSEECYEYAITKDFTFYDSVWLAFVGGCYLVTTLIISARLIEWLKRSTLEANLSSLSSGSVINNYLNAPAKPLSPEMQALYDRYQDRFDITNSAEENLCCSITQTLMQDPVRVTYDLDGHSYVKRYEHGALSAYWRSLINNIQIFINFDELRDPGNNVPLATVSHLRIEHDREWQVKIESELTNIHNPSSQQTASDALAMSLRQRQGGQHQPTPG